jgi:purine-nucleoside phosphorylase
MELNKIKESAKYINSKLRHKPEIGIILGSGLGDLANEVYDKITINYKDVPFMPVSTVKGHAGQFVFGTLSGKQVMIMQGRVHYYEGNSMSDLSIPIYIMKSLGIKYLVVTNAAGGVNTSFKPGDLMIITDHINLASINPLIGPNCEEIGPRFPDMSEAYSRELIEAASTASEKVKISVVKGVYAMMTGPSYETPAEIKMVRKLGADAVGMSTVPETIAANHCSIKVLGISCITNMAAGILDKPLLHAEVIDTSNSVKEKFSRYVKEIIKNI